MKEDYLKSLLENSAQHKAPKDLKKAVLMASEKGVEDKKERPQNGISIHVILGFGLLLVGLYAFMPLITDAVGGQNVIQAMDLKIVYISLFALVFWSAVDHSITSYKG